MGTAPFRHGFIGCLTLLLAQHAALAQYYPAQAGPYGYRVAQRPGPGSYPPGYTAYSPYRTQPYPAYYPQAAYPRFTPYQAGVPGYAPPGYASSAAPGYGTATNEPESQPAVSTPSAGSTPVVGMPASGSPINATPTSSPGDASVIVLPETAVVPWAPASNTGPYYPPIDPPPAPPVRFCREHCDKFWVGGGYQMGWLKPQKAPGPLITTGSFFTDTNPGALGQPGTGIVLGSTIDMGLLNGVWGEAGFFLDADNRYSIEARGFYLFQSSFSFRVASDDQGNPLLAHPIFNVANQAEGTMIIAAPAGQVAGNSLVEAHATLFGGEVNGRYHGYWGKHLHMDGLLGVRYLRLREDLSILDNRTDLGGGLLFFRGVQLNTGDQLITRDLFQTQNQFLGLQLGGRVNYEHTWWSLGVFGKLGLGVTDQQVQIDGLTTAVQGGVVSSATGGVYAQSSNIGDRSRSVFSIVPEFGMNFKVDVTKNIRVLSGYSILLWSNVLRPAGEIDRRIDPGLAPSFPNFGQVGTQPFPAFTFNNEIFWVHNLTLGVELHY